ncbi:MAG: gamma-glutamylcyclotransferase [Deltaproteobacteria bacterium]|nr:gamma-glutamylcyclotransferase [Deltaproteobacteria bacterium]MCB9789118.1 gamma-glutamylcyclotransferase [Deltaproteobacteria bacterium]
MFVYGSLMAGLEHHDVLAGARAEGAARTRTAYRLFAVDYYPAAVPGGGGPLEGELYRVDDDTLAALDAVEDAPELFERVVTALADGSEAFIYVLREERLPPSGAARPVPGGCWRTWREGQGSGG